MSSFSDLLQTIGKYSPLIASVLPIPGAGLIGQVLASAFGGDIKKPDELNHLIKSDPNAGIKLAEIQAHLQIELEKLAVTHAEITQLAQKNALDAESANIESDRLDRQNARELAKGSHMPSVVTIIIIFGFMVVIAAIMANPPNPESNILYLLFGTLSSAFTAAVSYWLGSSAGSKQKDQALTAAASSLSLPGAISANAAKDIVDVKDATLDVALTKPIIPPKK